MIKKIAFAVTPYSLLQPLPQTGTQVSTFGQYVSGIIPFILVLAAVLAVVELVVGGMQYALSESLFTKEDAKDRITKALLGLMIALVSWILLNTINPDLVKFRDLKFNLNISTTQ